MNNNQKTVKCERCGSKAVLEVVAVGWDDSPLSQYATAMSRGVSTGADGVFLIDAPFAGEADIVRTPVQAQDFGRYRFRPSSRKVINMHKPEVPIASGLTVNLQSSACERPTTRSSSSE